MKTPTSLILTVATLCLAAAVGAWEKVPYPDTTSTITGIQFVTADDGYLVTAQGACAFTSDGGESWHPVKVGDGSALEDVHFFNADTGLVCGARGSLYKTTDGGYTWAPAGTFDTSYHFLDMQFLGRRVGLIAGMQRSGPNPWEAVVMRTTDGGRTWTPQTGLGMGTWRFFYRPGQPLYLLSFGRLHMSIDSGKTWTATRTVEGPPGRTLFLNGRTGIIGGQAGMLAVSNDGGVHWRANDQGEEEQILSSYLLDENTGYIGGYRAVLKRTTDGGATWTAVAMPASMDIAEFYRTGAYLYAVGTRGGIMREKVK